MRDGGRDRTEHRLPSDRGLPAGGTWDASRPHRLRRTGLRSGLRQVSAEGGEPVALTAVDVENGETAHGWPHAIGEQLDPVHHGAARAGPPVERPRTARPARRSPLLLADGGGCVRRAVDRGFRKTRRDLRGQPRSRLRPARRRGAAIAAARCSGAPRAAPSAIAGWDASRFAAARDGTLFFAPPPATGGRQPRWPGSTGSAVPSRSTTLAARHQTPRHLTRRAPGCRGRRHRGSCAGISGCSTSRRIDGRQLTARGRRQPLARSGHRTVTTLTFASSRTGLQRLYRLRVRDLDVRRPPARRRSAHAGIVVARRTAARLPRAAAGSAARHLDVARRLG